MAASFEAFPPPLQGSEVYPATDAGSQPPYHSSGSFGTVFIVLAVVVVISAAACVLGRLCGGKKHSSGEPKNKKNKNKNKNGHDHHHDYHRDHHHKGYPSGGGGSKGRDVEIGFGSKGSDIELGFGGKAPKANKVAPNGGGHGRGQRPPPPNGHFSGGRPAQMGHHQMQMGRNQLPMMECPRSFQ